MTRSGRHEFAAMGYLLGMSGGRASQLFGMACSLAHLGSLPVGWLVLAKFPTLIRLAFTGELVF